MKDNCTNCNKEFSANDLILSYGPASMKCYCHECFEQLNPPTKNPVSYLSFPGVKNNNYSPHDIIVDVCSYFNVNIEDVKGRRRLRQVTTPRQICMYFIKQKFEDTTLKDLSEIFGRTHATSIYSINFVKNHMVVNSKFKATIKDLKSIIESRIINKNNVSILK